MSVPQKVEAPVRPLKSKEASRDRLRKLEDELRAWKSLILKDHKEASVIALRVIRSLRNTNPWDASRVYGMLMNGVATPQDYLRKRT